MSPHTTATPRADRTTGETTTTTTTKRSTTGDTDTDTDTVGGATGPGRGRTSGDSGRDGDDDTTIFHPSTPVGRIIAAFTDRWNTFTNTALGGLTRHLGHSLGWVARWTWRLGRPVVATIALIVVIRLVATTWLPLIGTGLHTAMVRTLGGEPPWTMQIAWWITPFAYITAVCVPVTWWIIVHTLRWSVSWAFPATGNDTKNTTTTTAATTTTSGTDHDDKTVGKVANKAADRANRAGKIASKTAGMSGTGKNTTTTASNTTTGGTNRGRGGTHTTNGGTGKR